MIRNLITLAALLALCSAAAAQPRSQRRSKRTVASETAQSDSLRTAALRLLQRVDSLESLLCAADAAARTEEECGPAAPAPAPVDPEQAAADSIADLRERLKPRRIASNSFDTHDLAVLDTLESGNDAVQVILFSNNTWKYVINREVSRDNTIFEKYWDTQGLFPYREADMSSMPSSVVIELLDSVTGYHCPYQGSIHPRGKYGPRRRRPHQGVDLPLKVGDPIYATFSGRVRISQYHRGGYGNLVIIRHDNGLETYYGHLSERMVEPDQWVEAGQIIGLGGSTGRSTGPHLHFETRYYGQSFDPERLIDFKTGELCRETFLLKKSFFSIYSKAGQDFEDEIANEEQDKKEAAEKAAMRYHKIKSGDTLGAIARRYGTTVNNICRLNGIKSTTVLRIGRTLRVK